MRKLIAIFLMGIAGTFFLREGLASNQEGTESARGASVAERVHQGNALFAKGDLEGALLYYQETLKEATEAVKTKIHYNLANTLSRLGRSEEAEREYKEALRLDPRHEDSKYNLEVTHLTEEGIAGVLRPQAEIEGAAEQLNEEILQLLQVLEQKEFGFPKGVPQPPTPPQPQSKQKEKDW